MFYIDMYLTLKAALYKSRHVTTFVSPLHCDEIHKRLYANMSFRSHSKDNNKMCIENVFLVGVGPVRNVPRGAKPQTNKYSKF